MNLFIIDHNQFTGKYIVDGIMSEARASNHNLPITIVDNKADADMIISQEHYEVLGANALMEKCITKQYSKRPNMVHMKKRGRQRFTKIPQREKSN